MASLPDRAIITPPAYNWNPIVVKSKVTGELIKIKDVRFNPELHERVEDGEVLFSTQVKPELAEEELGIADVVVDKPWVHEDGSRFKTEAALKSYITRLANKEKASE